MLRRRCRKLEPWGSGERPDGLRSFNNQTPLLFRSVAACCFAVLGPPSSALTIHAAHARAYGFNAHDYEEHYIIREKAHNLV